MYRLSIRGAGFLPSQGRISTHIAFSPEQIRAVRTRYEQQIHISQQRAAEGLPTRPTNYTQLWELGEELLKLLPGEVYPRLLDGLEQMRARPEGSGLRIILDVSYEARALLELPWELLVVPIDEVARRSERLTQFLCLHANVTFIRQVRQTGYARDMTLDPLLPPQVIAAQPFAHPIKTRLFRDPLGALFAERPLTQWWYEGSGTLRELRLRLLDRNPQLLQLICHGLESDTGLGWRSDILAAGDDGTVHRVSAFDLIPLLSLAPQLRVVILTICHSSGRTSLAEARIVSNIAFELVRTGVPMVIGMQSTIAQEAAAIFSTALYTRIEAGDPVDLAVSTARIAVYSEGWIVDWSLVTVYQAHAYREAEPWHQRLARRLDYDVFHPERLRGTRALLIAVLLLVMAASIARLLQAESPLILARQILIRASMTWGGIGLVLPSLIGLMIRNDDTQTSVSVDTLLLIRRAQYSGAYLGYALGGWTAGVIAASIYFIYGPGVSAWLWALIQAGVVLWSLVLSYVVARSQGRSSRILLLQDRSLFSYSSLALIYGIVLILYGIIPLVLWLDFFAALLLPFIRSGLGGIVLALLVLRMIISLDS